MWTCQRRANQSTRSSSAGTFPHSPTRALAVEMFPATDETATAPATHRSCAFRPAQARSAQTDFPATRLTPSQFAAAERLKRCHLPIPVAQDGAQIRPPLASLPSASCRADFATLVPAHPEIRETHRHSLAEASLPGNQRPRLRFGAHILDLMFHAL